MKDYEWWDQIKTGDDTQEDLKMNEEYRILSSINDNRNDPTKGESYRFLSYSPNQVLPKLGPFLVTRYQVKGKIIRSTGTWVHSMRSLLKSPDLYKPVKYGGSRHDTNVQEFFALPDDEMVVAFTKDVYSLIILRYVRRASYVCRTPSCI